MAKLFLVSYGGGHVAMLIPVAREALRRGHEVTFLGLTTARDALERAGIAGIGFRDLWRFAAPGAREFGAELRAQLPEGGTVAPEESEAYLGISFADLVAREGLAQARSLHGAQGRHAFLPVDFLQRVLADAQPDLVVATNSPRAEQAAILAAGRLDIPSVCAVDLFALQEVRWIGQPAYASRLCVLNEQVRRMFLDHGRATGEVVVTGNPAFDRLSEAAAVQAGAKLRQRRGWNDGRRTILWASQVEPLRHPFDDVVGDPMLPRDVERELRRIVGERDELRLVVRYHPSEQVAFEPAPRVEFSPASEPLAELLHAVDAVVVTASTVGIEAAMAGRPVLSIDSSVFTPDAPYSAMGISTGVERADRIEPALLGLVGKRPDAVAPSPGQSPGETATSRVMQVIETLVPPGA